MSGRGRYGEGMSTARHSAWSSFGKRHWRWFVFGPVIGRALAWVSCLVALSVAVWFVWLSAPVWLGWLAQYVVPAALVGMSLVLWAVGAVVLWRAYGWLWATRGLSVGWFTGLVSAGFVVMALGIGVVL